MLRLLRETGVTASAHLARIISTLILLKMVALYAGPEGLGFWANFISLVSIASNFAGGGILSGIIKYTAEYHSNPSRLADFSGATLLYASAFSVIALVLGFIFNHWLSQSIFGSQNYTFWINIFLFAQCFIALNNVFFGMINGRKKRGLYAVTIVLGNILAVLIICTVIPLGHPIGILFGIMAPVLCPFIPIMLIVLRKKWRNLKPLISLNLSSIFYDSKHLSYFSLMILTSTICFPIVEMIIRNQLIHQVSLDAAGYWAAITRLSSAGLSFFSLYLMLYFVPQVSAEKNNAIIFRQTCQCIAMLMVAMLLIIIGFALLGSHVLSLLYSSKFLVIKPWLLFHLFGDLFRVMSWAIGFLIVAKAMTKWYVLGELIQGGLFLCLAKIQLYYAPSVDGVVGAYVMTCIIYCMASMSIFYYIFRVKLNNESNSRSVLL